MVFCKKLVWTEFSSDRVSGLKGKGESAVYMTAELRPKCNIPIGEYSILSLQNILNPLDHYCILHLVLLY